MTAETESRPDWVEYTPYRNFLIESSGYKVSGQFKVVGAYGRGHASCLDTKLGFGVMGKFDTKESAVEAAVREGQRRIDTDFGPWTKGYLQGLKFRENPADSRIDAWFTSNADHAVSYETKEEAESTCLNLEGRIHVPTSDGLAHVCTGFKTERRAGRFVVFCEAPFTPNDLAA